MRSRPAEQSDRPVGRPAVERERTSQRIRRWIAGAEFAPGSRLPAHRELARRLDAHVFVVQLALQELAEEGFVELRGRDGTYVAQTPPHLRRFALAFAVPWDAPGFVRFWTVLAGEARRMKAEGEADFVLYSCVNRAHTEAEDYRRLLDDVQKHRLAGILFASPPHVVEGTAILKQSGIPRLAIGSHDGHAHVTALKMENDDVFFQRAVTWLRERDRRRLAWLGVPGSRWAEIPALAHALGMESRPPWVHVGIQGYPQPVANTMRLLAQLPAAERPDCLVITDDNLVEPACRGLRESGLRVPRDVEIVAHCNFPAPADSPPVQWLGYDIRNLLRKTVEVMRGWRNGTPPPREVPIPLEFEQEVRAREKLPMPVAAQE
jgi:DNA-binding LacI/PurR family transcriptional regulator